jgi:cell shape-determining protein MreC
MSEKYKVSEEVIQDEEEELKKLAELIKKAIALKEEAYSIISDLRKGTWYESMNKAINCLETEFSDRATKIMKHKYF